MSRDLPAARFLCWQFYSWVFGFSELSNEHDFDMRILHKKILKNRRDHILVYKMHFYWWLTLISLFYWRGNNQDILYICICIRCGNQCREANPFSVSSGSGSVSYRVKVAFRLKKNILNALKQVPSNNVLSILSICTFQMLLRKNNIFKKVTKLKIFSNFYHFCLGWSRCWRPKVLAPLKKGRQLRPAPASQHCLELYYRRIFIYNRLFI